MMNRRLAGYVAPSDFFLVLIRRWRLGQNRSRGLGDGIGAKKNQNALAPEPSPRRKGGRHESFFISW